MQMNGDWGQACDSDHYRHRPNGFRDCFNVFSDQGRVQSTRTITVSTVSIAAGAGRIDESTTPIATDRDPVSDDTRAMFDGIIAVFDDTGLMFGAATRKTLSLVAVC